MGSDAVSWWIVSELSKLLGVLGKIHIPETPLNKFFNLLGVLICKMGIMPVCRVGVKIKCITYRINTCSTKGQTIPIIQAGNNHIHGDRMVVTTAGRKEEWEVSVL